MLEWHLCKRLREQPVQTRDEEGGTKEGRFQRDTPKEKKKKEKHGIDCMRRPLGQIEGRVNRNIEDQKKYKSK